MYPSSSSSSSQGSMGSSGGSGLMRYGSAPGSLLTTAVDSVIGATRDFSAFGPQSHLGTARFFPAETSESTATEEPSKASNPTVGLQRSYGGAGSLVRHSSLPTGFLNQLAPAAGDNGFSLTRGIGNYSSKGIEDNGHVLSRLNSQLSFTRQEALSRISEKTENVTDGVSTDNGKRKTTNSYAGGACFGIGSWDNNDSIMFSVSPSRRAKTISGDIANGLDTMESQFQFGMPQSAVEMASMEKLLNIPHDSVPCKIRAKRGFATHPRSIAERERRTRISGKLKKLQDLVPNMDKQTGYADMLDLAVQHIKTLQDQVQKLNKEVESCTCGCNK